VREGSKRELEMGDLLATKRVSRRGAFALFGYAIGFGLISSSAIMMVSDADAETPATPATPSTEAPKSGTERRQDRRTGRAERRQQRRTGRTERRQARRTGRTERREERHDGPAEEKK
jgi:hypothetical protein